MEDTPIPNLEWSDKFLVNIPRIDEQRQQLVQLLREFCDSLARAPADEATRALERLNHYAEGYLVREEMVLRIRGYPEFREHQAEHDFYRATLGEMIPHGTDLTNIRRIGKFLSSWWREHIMVSDQRYAAYFRKDRKSEAA
jgi:hemerythrin-like metal-binding protein